MATSCGLDCDLCPAASRCGKTPNFCLARRCPECRETPLLRMDFRRAVIEYLGGLEFTWPRPVRHHPAGQLPVHLPVLVQGYADPIDLPWIALHAGRVLGVTGQRVTPKHRRPLREVYRLSPATRLALEFYVEDRVLEGLWSNRLQVIDELARLEFDLVLSPSVSVWRHDPRILQLVAQKKAFALYHLFRERGLPAIPDVGFSFFEPDGRLWAEWVNSQADLEAVSIYCGGRKIHAERRAHRETVEDIALFHQAVRPDVAFVLGGVHSPERLADYRGAAPGRRLVVCNGMAYALAQRRRLLTTQDAGPSARSARDCFLINSAHFQRLYGQVLGGGGSHALQG